MSVTDEALGLVARLWADHLRAPFPAQLRGTDLAGVDLVLLDADIAGIVSTWIQLRSDLDAPRRGMLAQCVAELDRVLPLLTRPYANSYYGRLRTMALTAAGGPATTQVDTPPS